MSVPLACICMSSYKIATDDIYIPHSVAVKMVVLVVLEFHIRRISSYITLPIYAIEPYHLWFLPAYL